MSAEPKLYRIVNTIEWAILGVLGLLLIAAIGGAVLALIGAIGGWSELKALGGYTAAIGAGGFFVGMLVMGPLVSGISRVTDRGNTR
ncbi:MAG: hypothetical protein IKE42_03870 [Aquamicrobium sp.]|uniref:hypothetical protein n=1 Tax=Mesorhizobium sp. Pch-S TaxID=2082387 RepID=UPI0010138F77|nr:hypothetical protein [Mesorhizobium sp. Pch-S]MBR2686966.1 hypothetical protein [Aquamicrobium sp.]QAZ46727.1 hypothetical protein C1M53_31220 [Mesorhizobium sp. Pch-S]